MRMRDFPGGPVAKTPRSQYKGPWFNPWLGNQIPHAPTKIQWSQTKIINLKKEKNEDEINKSLNEQITEKLAPK